MIYALLILISLICSCSSVPVREVASNTTNRATLDSLEIKSALKEENPTTLRLREKGTRFFLNADYPKAIQQLETAFLLSNDIEETKSKFHLFYAYLATGDYKKALTTAEFVLNLHPYLSLSYQQVGLAHYFLGHTSEALESFQKALEFDAHSPRLHFYKGLVQARLNNSELKDKAFRLAEKEYRQILKFNKDDLSANYELASLFLFWNTNVNEAPFLIHNVKTILESEKEEFSLETKKAYSEFYLPLLEGIYSYRQSDPQKAIDSLLTAFTNAPSGSKPDLAETYFYLGLSHRLNGEKEQARTLLEQSLLLDPNGPLAADATKTIRDLARK